MNMKSLKLPMIAALMLAALSSLALATGDGWQLRELPDGHRYRSAMLGMELGDLTEVDALEIRLAEKGVEQDGSPQLHSIILVGNTTGLSRVPPEEALSACWADGLPAFKSRGRTVIDNRTRELNCLLSGLEVGQDYRVSLHPVASGLLRESAAAVWLRTDVPDVLAAPPDSRPVAYALGGIVSASLLLLAYLNWRDRRRRQTSNPWAHAYLIPALIGLAALTIYPICYGIWLAFTDADQRYLGAEQFIGIQNFIDVWSTPGVLRVLGFTLAWTLGNVVFHISLGLPIALTLNHRRMRGKSVYRSILILPWAIPAYISVLAWGGMFQVDGLINSIFGTEVDFLAGSLSARVSVIAVNVWLGVPFMVVMLLGALQAVPQDMYEAASLEGVPPRRQFTQLTFPAIKNTVVTLSLLDFIWSFNMFNTIYLLTRGNPYVAFGEPGATDILVTYIYTLAFEQGHYGIAAAWSVIIFVALMVFSYGYIKQTRVLEGRTA